EGVTAGLQRSSQARVEVVAAVVVFQVEAVAGQLQAGVEFAGLQVDRVHPRLVHFQRVGLVAALQPVGDAAAGGQRFAVIGDDGLDGKLERTECACVGTT